MIDRVTIARIIFRLVPVGLSVLGFLNALVLADTIDADIERMKVVDIDRVERHRTQYSDGPVRYREEAYVVCEPVDGTAEGEAEPSTVVLAWGSFSSDVEDGDVDDLIGQVFWANLATRSPLSDYVNGALALVIAAGVVIALSAAPLSVGGVPDNDRSLRWRGSWRDVAVGGVIVIAALPFAGEISPTSGPDAFDAVPVVAIGLSFLVAIYSVVAIALTIRR